MKKILARLQAAAKKVEEAQKAIANLPKEEVKQMEEMAAQLQKIKQGWLKAEEDIQEKQNTYFTLLANCVAILVNSWKFTLNDTEIETYARGALIVTKNVKDRKPHHLEVSQFSLLAEAMIDKIEHFSTQLNLEEREEDVAARTEAVRKLCERIAQLCESEGVKKITP